LSNHTINSWKRFCLYHKDAIEDLRDRAIGNAEKKSGPKDKDATETGVSEEISPAPQLAYPPESQLPSSPPPPPPPPPCEKATEPGPVVVKTEPLDDDQQDFAFATDVLSSWNANYESDEALWKRMGSMVRYLVFSPGFRNG
jgi:hypothetical protein